ncbi:hypothetical protein BHF71_02295 [Vulcanibacillus modesticaldus]|uniref:Nuclease SbcCD subunit D n=1 Tax=Vulcanibacillus modesticaldus TaxID=337097 RepID=A0A1D2YTN3_9BACI|nr:exonuclease SbcCD subunit D [Vulcanibacillus modesticaldus]OEF99039.1 hypothetical protein BHF71_02295 [Vulcanibacillus modesticaldus]
MRLLHTSDWHLGKSLEGRDRKDEQIKVMDEICHIADEENIDLVLIAGDIYQTVNPPAWAENLFYETLHRLNNNGERGVVVISGNHDQPERIRAANPLADKQGIYLIGLPSDQIYPSIYQLDNKVYTINAGSGWLELALPKAKQSTLISVLPYPSESRLGQLFSNSLDIKEIRSAYSIYIKKWFEKQQSLFKPETINLAISHLFVQGGITSESEIEIQVGGAYTVVPEHIPDFYHYVALGHLHRAQDVKGTRSLTRYAGSPLAYSFSEANHKKSVTIIEINPNETVQTKEILLQSGKPLIQKKIKNGIEELEKWIENEAKNPAWIDLELHLPNPLSIEEIGRIRKMHEGLVNIRVITPELEKSMELIEISSKHPIELFEKFYEHKTGAKPRKEVLELFNEIFNSEDEVEVED